MDKRIGALIRNWRKRNISGLCCMDKTGALDKILELIPKDAAVGLSGSVTLEQLGVLKKLEERFQPVFNQYQAGLTREQGLEIRRKSTQADYYLASPNAIAETGELIFFSAYGNRIAGVSYAKNVVLVSGINKIVPDIQSALKRAREYVTPLNCKRLNWESACLENVACRQEVCFSPEYKRMCGQILIIETEVIPGRLKVILVNEELGF